MPFVKDKLYQNMPFSNETPRDQFHSCLSVAELLDKIRLNPNYAIRCRTVGILTSDYGEHVLHEIENNDVRVPLSLAHLSHAPPFTGTPYAAQVFGFILWEENVGPVLYSHIIKQLPAYIALRLRDTLKWVVDTHYAFLDDKQDE